MSINGRSGIKHIEDLPIIELVETLQNLETYQVYEKIDGSELLFGLDDHGFYTSRETKGGKRIYDSSDYELRYNTSYMKTAHLALLQILPELKSAGLSVGDQIEIEVLYGEIPNAVRYDMSTNRILFLRTTMGNNILENLSKLLSDKEVTVENEIPFTPDGIEILTKNEITKWKFSTSEPLGRKVDLSDFNLELSEFMAFLNSESSIEGVSNMVLLNTPMNKCPSYVESSSWKEQKSIIHNARDDLRDITTDKILSLKYTLLDIYVLNQDSIYSDHNSSEYFKWIEGVVFRNKEGKQFKLVNKSVFLNIKNFYWLQRSRLTDRSPSENQYSGKVGNLLVELGSTIGYPVLGTTTSKKFISTLKEPIVQISKGLEYVEVKLTWLRILKRHKKEIETMLDSFKKEHNRNGLIVFHKNNSHYINLPSAVVARTLETYSSVFKLLNTMEKNIKNSSNIEDLLSVLISA